MRSTRLILATALVAVGLPLAATAQTSSPARCADGTPVGSRTCSTEAYLLEVLESRGVEEAMATLESLVAADEDTRRDAHSYAHAIGIAAYDGSEEVGEVFARCTPAHQSGCYHGVIQSYFSHQLARSGGQLDGRLVNDLCREHRENPDARWLLFQCAHGMGHGLVMLADRHLPTSLEGCDLVGDGWEREACYGGVFMENIVHATVPEEAVGRPVGGAEHAHHHDHGVTATAATMREEFPPLREDDPLYPCNALPDRYGAACYAMQTSAILHFNGRNIAAAARTCGTAPEMFRPICYQSLGRDISALSGQTHSRAIELCATAPADYQPWCHTGYTKNLIDLTADPDDGFAYCRLLPDGESKRFCYVAVGEQIWVLHDGLGQREALCGASEAAYVDACRAGAGLIESAAAPAPAGAGRAPALPGRG